MKNSLRYAWRKAWMRLEPLIGRHPLLAAFVINVLLFAAVYAALTPHYVTTDDPAMTMQAAGVCMVDEATGLNRRPTSRHEYFVTADLL